MTQDVMKSMYHPLYTHFVTKNAHQALKAFIESERLSSTPFDIALGGQQRSADWEQERALIKSLAEVGATWWIEWIPPTPLDVMRACIQRGPLRVD